MKRKKTISDMNLLGWIIFISSTFFSLSPAGGFIYLMGLIDARLQYKHREVNIEHTQVCIMAGFFMQMIMILCIALMLGPVHWERYFKVWACLTGIGSIPFLLPFLTGRCSVNILLKEGCKKR